MEGVYGKGVTAREVLKENKVHAPAVVQVFPQNSGWLLCAQSSQVMTTAEEQLNETEARLQVKASRH